MREEYRVRSVYEEALGAWLEGGRSPVGRNSVSRFLHLEAKERWKDAKLQKDIAQSMVANGWYQEKQQRLGGYGRVRLGSCAEKGGVSHVTHGSHLSHKRRDVGHHFAAPLLEILSLSHMSHIKRGLPPKA